MAESINASTEQDQPMTPEEEALYMATNHTQEWFENFLEEFGNLSISDVESYSSLDETDAINGLYVLVVDEEGGYEGGGEHAEKVFGVIKSGGRGEPIVHFRVIGCYYSYAGTTWDDKITVVEPREVTVTQWFDVESSDDN